MRTGPTVLRYTMLLVAAVVIVVSLALHAAYIDVPILRLTTESMYVHADFDTFLRSAKAAVAGRDIYETGARLPNLNPPFWTLVLLPMASLDLLTGYRLFAAGTLLVMLAAMLWVAREVGLRPWVIAVATVAVLVSSPLYATLALGQVYPLLTFGLVAAWIADRRDRPVLSGVALGLVIAAKPSLLLLGLWPAVRGRWRAAGSVVVSGVAATLVALVVLGIDATTRYADIVLGYEVDGHLHNATLVGGAVRSFTENPYVAPLALAPWTVPLATGLGVALVVATAWWTRHDPEIGLWALVAAVLLAAPIAWNNYLLLVVPGVLVLLSRGRIASTVLLLALQFFPQTWYLTFQDLPPTVATLAGSVPLYVLVVHWLCFVAATVAPVGDGTRGGGPAAGQREGLQALDPNGDRAERAHDRAARSLTVGLPSPSLPWWRVARRRSSRADAAHTASLLCRRARHAVAGRPSQSTYTVRRVPAG